MADLYINSRLTIPDRELSVTAARSSGPGGQNVNKVNSKITLRWAPQRCQGLPRDWCRRFVARYAGRINRDGELVLHSQRYRDQGRNLADARSKLAEMLRECQSPPLRRQATRPTLAATRRRLDSKRRRAEKKQNRRPSWDDH